MNDNNKLKKEYKEIREQWILKFTKKEINIDAIIIKTYENSKTGKALLTMPLWFFLSELEGWSKTTAKKALLRNELNSSTIQTIRSNKAKCETFKYIALSVPSLNKTRSEPPKGWPFGKKMEIFKKHFEALSEQSFEKGKHMHTSTEKKPETKPQPEKEAKNKQFVYKKEKDEFENEIEELFE